MQLILLLTLIFKVLFFYYNFGEGNSLMSDKLI